jgi:hypothetical protein
VDDFAFAPMPRIIPPAWVVMGMWTGVGQGIYSNAAGLENAIIAAAAQTRLSICQLMACTMGVFFPASSAPWPGWLYPLLKIIIRGTLEQLT